jgi:hypothetical protein
MLAATILLAATCDEPVEELSPEQVATEEPLASTAEAAVGTPVPPVDGWSTIRYLNLTVAAPTEGPLRAAQHHWGPDGVASILITFDDSSVESYVVIDAATGKEITRSIHKDHEALLDQVLVTARLSPDATGDAPWPVNDTDLPTERRTVGIVGYLVPDPASGFQVFVQHGLPPEGSSNVCPVVLGIQTAKSIMFINTCTGNAEPGTPITDSDKPAFDRYLSSIEVAKP